MSEELEKDIISLNLRLKQREDEYTVKENFKIFCGTYNLKGKIVDESLQPWFCFHEPCDLYVLGFQELCELSTSSILLNNDWVDRENTLIHHLNQTFGSNKKLNLEFFKLNRLWGILLVIYARRDLINSISDVMMDSVATGILNTLGNKGSVAISFKLHETRLCFLSSHFASDTEHLERRNADYRYTIEKLRFYSEKSTDLIDFDSHHLTIWVGDFNYRLNNLPLDKTLELIYKNDFDELLKYDQLNDQLNQKRVFKDFQEGKIKFKPTYKYTVREDKYDIITNSSGQSSVSGSGSSTKVKLPSWTDRVLYKPVDGTNCKLVQYSCINTLTCSDHKPVYAIFNTEVKRIDVKLQKKIYDSLLKESDRKKNEERPRICLLTHPPELNFGPISYYKRKTLSFEIRNEGKSIASVEIDLHINDSKLNEGQICFINNHFSSQVSMTEKKLQSVLNEWIKMKRTRIDLSKPGQIFSFEVSNNFSNTNIARLNRQKHLDDILIVKCSNGNDLFVNVCCDYLPTIMGVSLKVLSFLEADKPYIEYDSEWIKNIENEIYANENKIDKFVKSEFEANKSKPSNPIQRAMRILRDTIISADKYFNNDLSKEYQFLLDYLIKRAEDNLVINDEASSKSEGIEDEKDFILKSISSSIEHFEIFYLKPFDIETLLEVLCDLLNCLPTALIPRRFFDLCMNLNFSYHNCLDVLRCLPKCHITLFSLIIKFIYSYSKNNEINYNSIAKAIFQSDNELFQKNISDQSLNEKNCLKFINLFIENYDTFQIHLLE